MQTEIHLKLLKLLEKNPTATQRELADALGVSLGKTNYCLKALKEKGWVKWGNFSKTPNKLQYMHLLTPQGMAEKLSLTLHFLARKQKEFEELEQEIVQLQQELIGQEDRTPQMHPNQSQALCLSTIEPSIYEAKT
jgi:EPS-associated MarR family transcriptional regulator